jgi:hypothetical protein
MRSPFEDFAPFIWYNSVPLRSSKITLDLQEEYQENLVQNETIPTVERSNFERDFGNTAAFQLTLHMEQTSTILSRTYVLETRVDAASKDGDGLVWEVGQEELRFKALNFTMLDGEGSKEVIKFNLIREVSLNKIRKIEIVKTVL